MKKKPVKSRNDSKDETCANCGKVFTESGYGILARYILGNHKPACSYECNKTLGQAR